MMAFCSSIYPAIQALRINEPDLSIFQILHASCLALCHWMWCDSIMDLWIRANLFKVHEPLYALHPTKLQPLSLRMGDIILSLDVLQACKVFHQMPGECVKFIHEVGAMWSPITINARQPSHPN